MIQSFEGRTRQGYLLSIIPKPAAPYLGGMLVVGILALVIENRLHQAILVMLVAIGGYLVWDIWKGYAEYQLRKARENGGRMNTITSFGGITEQARTGRPASYGDYFGWKTSREVVDRFDQTVECLDHHDGAVSLAFEWDGIRDLNFGDGEFEAEHKRKLSLLKALHTDGHLVVEHHLIRHPDSGLVDAYELEGRLMYGDEPPPRIVQEVRQGIAAMGRRYGRNNRTVVVLSMNARAPGWFGMLPSQNRRNRGQQNAADTLVDCYHDLKAYYPGARLLSREAYRAAIQQARDPRAVAHGVEWRFALNDQLIHAKPVWNERYRCLELDDGRYCKVALLFKYPAMPINWPHLFVTAGVDLHVVQVVRPKNTQAALDKNKKSVALERDTANDRRSTALLNQRVRDIATYEQFVADRGLPVADNVFCVTLFGADPVELESAFNLFNEKVQADDGVLKCDRDLQWEMYRTRLPGLGRQSLFMREDHGDSLAVMMPFTTLSRGNPHPESLRLSASGQLVGFSPSTLSVPHELVVADTGAGKDNQFGIKVLETYPRVRYDIIELTNTYQGLVEAIGGRYCQARDEVINPLMGYQDFAGALAGLHKLQNEEDRISRALLPQQTVLTPIFKGLDGGDFTTAEQVVMFRALQWVYANPVPGQDAPTLPRFEDAFHHIELDEVRWRQARDHLGEQLMDFLNGTEGSAFKASSQFIISPVANAIDFDRMEGKLADYFLTFLCVRLANNAFARGTRSQIVLNEYKVLLERNPDVIRWITVAIDRLGRKDAVGLSRISQGMEEIQSVDSEALNSIQSKTLLYRKDKHEPIATALKMPYGLYQTWQDFKNPDLLPNYREAVVCERSEWHHLILKFPEIGLKLMNTDHKNKAIRLQAYRESQDAYERIAIMDRLMEERAANDKQAREKYADAIL